MSFPQSDKNTMEGAIYWQLNPNSEDDYGSIKVYVDKDPIKLVDTGIQLDVDTQWHSFDLVIDFANRRYVSITIDDIMADLSEIKLAEVPQGKWGEEVSLNITTESMASWPQEDCEYVFTWAARYKDLTLSQLTS